MVSLVINSPSLWRGANYTADVRWQPPARETRHPARADSGEPDAGRADAQAVGRRSSIGAEYEAGLSRRKACGGADVRAGTWYATAQDRGVPDSDARTG